MDNSFETLSLLVEILVAFVAFSAIVASIRVTWGEKLTPFQSLLVHFFIVSSMLGVTIALLPFVLKEFWADVDRVATVTVWVNFFLLGGYLIYYVRKRIKIKAPFPLASLITFSGWAIMLVILLLSMTELFWEPSLAIVTVSVFWVLIANVIIFITFLGNFFGGGRWKKFSKGKK